MKYEKSVFIWRLLFTGVLCVLVYMETGPATAISIFLISVAIEMVGASHRNILAQIRHLNLESEDV